MRTEYDTNESLSNKIETGAGRARASACRVVGAVLLAALVGAGCRGTPAAVPGPGADAHGERLDVVTAAERSLRGGDVGGAERLLVEAGGVSADAPQRSWVLIDLWTARCAVAQARAATDALPPGALADVLAAHARIDPQERLRLVRPALASPSAAPWAHLESAFALADEGGRAEAVVAHAQRAAAIGGPFVAREAWLLAARALLEDRKAVEAAAAADRAAALDPSDPRAPATASRIAARRGALDDAGLLAARALRLQPRSSRAARRLADLVRDGLSPAVERRVGHEVGSRAVESAEAEALAALLAERGGDVAGAVARYERALASGCDPVPVDRALRRLLFATGRRRRALDLLFRAVPPDARTRADSLLRGAWAAVDAERSRARDGPPSRGGDGELVSLARALVGVGAVDDAAAVLGDAATADAVALRTELVAELAFQREMRQAVEEGYRAPATDATPVTLDALLLRIQRIARARLAPARTADFDRPADGMRRMPFLGAWLDHSADTTSPVVAHFRRYGRLLVLGQRAGKPAEAIVLSLASLTRRQEVRTQGRVFRHDVAVGYDRTMRGYVDFQGGSLSGAALPDGVWLDADATRREDHALRSAVAGIDGVHLERLRRATREAPAVDGPLGVLAMDDTAGLPLRLARRYLARAAGSPWGALDVLAAHEFGHVLDLDRHLPIVKGLPATLGLLASEGFAFDRVEARLEGRAQLGAVVDARDPDLALIDLVRVLPLVERTPEAHDRGYRDVARAMVAWVARHADRFPAIDATRKVLPQLDRLSPEEIREVARAVAASGWPTE